MGNQIQKKTYPGLDVGKFLCAFLILFYHYFSEHGGLPGILDEALSLYAVAVALFMVISGFLLFNKLEGITTTEQRWTAVKKQVKRIYTIYLLWSVPYLLYTMSRWSWNQLTADFIFWQIQGWVFKSTFYTIWFMPMLAIGTIVAFWLTEKLPQKSVVVLATVCYLIGSLQMTYKFAGLCIPGFSVFMRFSDTWLGGARGWLFFAFPLIMVGRMVVRYKDRFRPVPAFCATIGCVGLMLVEALMLRRISGGHTGIDLAIMMVPTVFFACGFLICIPLPNGKHCIWMRNMSTLIFMSQRLFLTVVPSFLQINQITNHVVILFLAMCGGTLLFSFWILLLGKKVPAFRKLY